MLLRWCVVAVGMGENITTYPDTVGRYVSPPPQAAPRLWVRVVVSVVII